MKKRSPLVLILTIVLLFALLLSPWGMQLAIYAGNHSLKNLTIDYQSGGLTSQIQLARIRWQTKQLTLNIEHLNLQLKLDCLLNGDICIDQLSTGAISADVRQTPNATAAPSQPIAPLQLPVAVIVDKLQLGPLKVNMAKQWQLSWQRLDSRFALKQKLDIEQLAIADLTWQQLTAAPSGTASSKPFDFNAWQYQPPAIPDMQLPLPFNLKALSIAPLTLAPTNRAPVQIQRLSLSAQSRQQQQQQYVKLRQLTLDHDDFSLAMHGQLALNRQLQHELTMQLTVARGNYAGQKLNLQSQGSLSALHSKLTLSGNSEADIEFHADLSSRQLPLQLKGNWHNLQWPAPAPQYTSAQGNISISGDLAQLQLQLNADASGKDLPTLQVQLAASGTPANIEIQQLSAQSPAGNLNASGQLTLAEQQLTWHGLLKLDHLRSEQFWPQVNSDISGELQSDALYSATHWQANLSKLALDGRWQGLPLKATGTVNASSVQGIVFDHLSLANGDNKLLLNGDIDAAQQLALEFDLQAQDLSQSLPGANGRLTLQGKANGSLSTPQLAFNIDAKQLQYSEWQVAAMQGHGSIVWDDIKPVELKLQLADVSSLNHHIEQLTLALNGNAEQHRLSLDGSGEQASVSAQFTGRLRQQQWHGQWLSGRIVSNYAKLTLQQPFAIDANWQQQHYVVAPHCWQQQQSSLCIKEAQYHQGQASWDIALHNLPAAPLINRLNSTLPELQSTSNINLQLSGRWSGQGLPDATLNAELSPASWQVKQHDSSGWALEHASLSATLANDQARLTSQLAGPKLGQLSLDLQLATAPGERPLSGQLQLQNFALQPLRELMPELERLAGIVNIDSKIAGTLKSPLLYGQATVSDGELAGGNIPVVLKQWQQKIQLNGQQATLDGSYHLGDGSGKIKGELAWLPTLNGRLQIEGQNLSVNYQSMLQATLSPNITLQFSPGQFDVNGEIAMPYARIKLRELPESAVPLSSDVVLVTDKPESSNLQQALTLDINLLLDPQLRHQVKLDAFGLTTELAGELRLQQSKQHLLANGGIRLNNGRYRAYGQNLLIREGELLFQGPLDRPHIALEAIRDPKLTADEVIAGIRVSGAIEKPEVSLFSDPVLEQPQLLSYLLRGQNLGSGNDESQDTTLTNMLLGLGIGRSENLVGHVGQKLGVKDLALDTSGQGDNTQLTLSGYIAPGVQLHYGVGVFNSASEVALRYELLPQLYLEAVSGLSNSLDVYYRFSVK